MTRIEQTSVTILALALIGALLLLAATPEWAFLAGLSALLSTSLALIGLQRPIGYTVGQAGMFLVFLMGISYAIGDWEVPKYVEKILSAHGRFAIVCVLYVGCAIAIDRAQVQMRGRLQDVAS